MNHERERHLPQTNTQEKLLHSGNFKGKLRENHYDEDNSSSVQEFQGLDTDQLQQVAPAPETSGELILTDEERSSREFQEKTDYYKQKPAETEAGWLPSGSESLAENVEQKKKGNKSLFIKIGAAAATVGVALTTYLSTQSGDKGEDGPTPTQPVATAEATAGQTQKVEEKVDVTKRPQSIVEQGLFNKLSPEQQSEIRKLNDMPTTEFYKLPMATQLKYAQYIYDTNVERTKYLIQQNGSKYAPLLKTVEPKPDNSGTEVWYQQQLRTEVQYTLMPDQKPLDKINAQKMIVLGTTQDTAGFMIAFNAIETDKGGLLTPDNNPILAYKSEVQGNEATMKINANVDDKITQTTYDYTTFTDISGKERGAWQATLSVSNADPRFDGSIK
jgi:hypothetical protein